MAIPNGVPVPATPWQRRPDWRASPRAAFVGRLAPEKGLDTLIDAWPAVRAAYPDGPADPDRRRSRAAALEARVAARGLALGPGQAVEMPGAATDATAALRDVDLFVLPSREEGMSIALLEAMALGVPAVASSIPGNRRLIGDFKHGRLAPPDDPEGLARVIIEQWANFDRAFHMSRAARSRVEQEFSIRIVARKHLELFRRFAGTVGSEVDRPLLPSALPTAKDRIVLKVLQLIPTLDRSGAEKQMVMLAKGLPRDRFRVEVAALTRSGPLEAELDAAGSRSR